MKSTKEFTEQEVRSMLALSLLKQKQFVTFRHFRRDSGAVTACCVVTKHDKTLSFLVGFGLCNPEDHFSRKRGREEAMKCLALKPIQFNDVTKIADPIIKYMRDYKENGMLDSIADTYYHKNKDSALSLWFPKFVDEL